MLCVFSVVSGGGALFKICSEVYLKKENASFLLIVCFLILYLLINRCFVSVFVFLPRLKKEAGRPSKATYLNI